MSPRRRRILSIAWKVLAILVVLLIYFAWPGRQTFTVSPETTYVTGPLDKDGYVDYVTALNERLSKGITPENNANVLIWQALGPHPEGANMPSEYFKWLGIDPPPEQGEYFVSYVQFLKHRDGNEDTARREEFEDRLERAIRWPWKASENPELAAWLKQNEKPLRVLADAGRRPDFYNPLVPRRTEDWSPGLLSSLLPNVQMSRETTKALACRAMLRSGEGKRDQAWSDLLTAHRLSRLLSRGGTLIEMLVGIATDRVASEAELAFLSTGKLTSTQVAGYSDDVRKLPPMALIADKMNMTERFMFLDALMLLVDQGIGALEGISDEHGLSGRPSRFRERLFTRSVDWDGAMRNGNRAYDRYSAACRLSDRGERIRASDQIEQDIHAAVQEIGDRGIGGRLFMGPKNRGEAIGNILLGLFLPAFSQVQSALERCEQTQRNLHLAFALARFRADNRNYPAKLDELAPKYLDKIPNDLFSDKPLIYKPNGDGYLLYSVGPNGKDDEGRMNDDDPRGDDITVRMPVRAPREMK